MVDLIQLSMADSSSSPRDGTRFSLRDLAPYIIPLEVQSTKHRFSKNDLVYLHGKSDDTESVALAYLLQVLERSADTSDDNVEPFDAYDVD